MKVGIRSGGAHESAEANGPNETPTTPVVVNPITIDRGVLRWVRGPETSAPSRAGIGRTILSALVGKKDEPTDERTADERRAIEDLQYKLRRPGADLPKIRADLTRRYLELARQCGPEDTKLRAWLEAFPSRLGNDVPDAMLDAWIPLGGGGIERVLARRLVDDREAGARLVGSYLAAAADDPERMASRITAFTRHEGETMMQVREEALLVFLASIDLADDKQTRAAFSLLAKLPDHAAPREWIDAAVGGASNEQLGERVRAALRYSRQDLSEAAVDRARIHVLDPDIDAAERGERLKSLMNRRRPGELSSLEPPLSEGCDALLAQLDVTDGAELQSVLPVLQTFGRRPDAGEMIARWRAAGVTPERMRTLTLEVQYPLGTDVAAEILHRLAQDASGGDRVAFARAIVERAKASRHDRGAPKASVAKSIEALVTHLGPDAPELTDLVLEAAGLAKVQFPKDLRVFTDDPVDQLARALPQCRFEQQGVRTQAIQVVRAALSKEHAPDFNTLLGRLDQVLDAEVLLKRASLSGGSLERIVGDAFDRLCALSGGTAAEGAALGRTHDRLVEALGSQDVPDAHLLEVYGRGDPPEQVFERALNGLNLHRTNDARKVVKGMLEAPNTATPHRLLLRLEKVMARIDELATGEEARLRGAGRSWRMMTTDPVREAKEKMRHLVRDVVKDGYEQLAETGDWADDRVASFLMLAPVSLRKNGVHALVPPADRMRDVFNVPRPLSRAAALTDHFDASVATEAKRIVTEVAPADAYEALATKHGARGSLRRPSTELEAHLTLDGVRAMFDAPDLDPFELATRIDLLATDWLSRPETSRDRAMIMDALRPAFERFVETADFSDARQAKFALEIPARFADAAVDVNFPAAHTAGLFASGSIGVDRAIELVAHPDDAVRAEAVRFLEARWDAHPTERKALLEDLHAAITASAAPPKAKKNAKIDLSKAGWARMVDAGLDLATSDAMQLAERLEQKLVAAARTRRDPIAGLAQITSHLEPSIARDLVVDEFVGTPEWIDRDVLEAAADGYGSGRMPKGAAAVLVQAIGRYTGNPAHLVECLEGRVPPAALAMDVADDQARGEAILERMSEAWQGIDERLRPKVLERGLVDAFGSSKQPAVVAELNRRGIADPESLFRDALRTHALDALAADPDAKDLGEKIERVFSELPSRPRARILTALLLAPPTNDAPTLIRRLAEAGGVVAIKSAQQMCEDPDVPERFRTALEDLRDQNARMAPTEVWRQMHHSARADIAALGVTLGVGSVKQALLVRMTDGVEALAAVVRAEVPMEIKETVGALRLLDETRHLIDRIEPMLAREINLVLEAEAFEALRASSLGAAKVTSVPKVLAVHGNVLIRELSAGAPMSSVLRKRVLNDAEKERLTAVHRLLVQSALETSDADETFVLTDPHQGNLADDGFRIGLFDPGQYENLTAGEAELFVRYLAAFSRTRWSKKKKGQLVAGLAPHCKLAEGEKKVPSVADRLSSAYAAAFRDPDATAGRKLQLFLLDASKRGVAIPNGYFGLAKMLHSLQSQGAELGLPDVVGATIRDLYLDHVGPFGRLYRAFSRSE